MELFVQLFNLYTKFNVTPTHLSLHARMRAISETPNLTMGETLMTMQVLRLVSSNRSIDDVVVFTDAIPNFMTEDQRIRRRHDAYGARRSRGR